MQPFFKKSEQKNAHNKQNMILMCPKPEIASFCQPHLMGIQNEPYASYLKIVEKGESSGMCTWRPSKEEKVLEKALYDGDIFHLWI